MKIVLCICYFVIAYVTKSINAIQGELQGIPCFTRRNITGCSKGEERMALILLFTRKNPDNPEFLHECGYRLPSNTNFNESHRTVIINHGYLEGLCRQAWMREMKDQFLIRCDYNVLLVDWSKGSGPDYTSACNNVKIVCQDISYLVKNVINSTELDPNNIYVVGQSLGAHISGCVGKCIPGIGRITGLDPAGYPFQNASCENRLCHTDAQLVDVMHTGSGTCLALNFGDIYPLGHADFYVNGGHFQKACLQFGIQSLLKGDIIYGLTFILLPQLCSHGFATQVFKVTINPGNCQMIGIKCESYETFEAGNCRTCECKTNATDCGNCAVMGFDFQDYYTCGNSTNNIYYLDIVDNCPYCDNSKLNLTCFPVDVDGHCP